MRSSLSHIFLENWRRGPGSNRRIKVLQTSGRLLSGLPRFYVTDVDSIEYVDG